MHDIRQRYNAASGLFIDLLAELPRSKNLPECYQVYQRQRDTARAIAANENPSGLIELYIKAVLEFDDVINSMSYEDRMELKKGLDNFEEFYDE